jgi:predicted GNAT family acetyltransferase
VCEEAGRSVADETDQTPVVTRNENSSRYEIRFGGRVAGRVAFTHTVVDPEFEGHGLGSTLVRSALTDTADRGETIVPFCPFVQDWLKRHTEFDGAVDWAPVTT